jgi:CTD kinase subunit alpha
MAGTRRPQDTDQWRPEEPAIRSHEKGRPREQTLDSRAPSPPPRATQDRRDDRRDDRRRDTHDTDIRYSSRRGRSRSGSASRHRARRRSREGSPEDSRYRSSRGRLPSADRVSLSQRHPHRHHRDTSASGKRHRTRSPSPQRESHRTKRRRSRSRERSESRSRRPLSPRRSAARPFTPHRSDRDLDREPLSTSKSYLPSTSRRRSRSVGSDYRARSHRDRRRSATPDRRSRRDESRRRHSPRRHHHRHHRSPSAEDRTSSHIHKHRSKRHRSTSRSRSRSRPRHTRSRSPRPRRSPASVRKHSPHSSRARSPRASARRTSRSQSPILSKHSKDIEDGSRKPVRTSTANSRGGSPVEDLGHTSDNQKSKDGDARMRGAYHHQGRGNASYSHSPTYVPANQYSPQGQSPYGSSRGVWAGQPGHPYPHHGYVAPKLPFSPFAYNPGLHPTATRPISRPITKTVIIIRKPTHPSTIQASSIKHPRIQCSQAIKMLPIVGASAAIITDQTAERQAQLRIMPIRRRKVSEAAVHILSFPICRGPQVLALAVGVKLPKHPVNRRHKRPIRHRVKRQLRL